MTSTLYAYSGTGNSLWAARRLAEQLGGGDVVPMLTDRPVEPRADVVGIVFPVHIWGVPRRVMNLISNLKLSPQQYCFAVAVNAGQVAATLLQMKRVMAARGLPLSAGFSVVMPSNYIPWGGAAPLEKQQQLFAAAGKKIASISAAVTGKLTLEMEKGPLWQNILFTWFYNMSCPHVHEMDKKFRVDDKCDGCRICERICPAKNIVIKGGRPSWNSRCEQCLACIQWCPKEAIQYGKKTPGYARYHHPEIKAADLIRMAGA